VVTDGVFDSPPWGSPVIIVSVLFALGLPLVVL